MPSGAERAAARAALGLPPDVPVVLFVGALGTDINKGFDRALAGLAQPVAIGAVGCAAGRRGRGLARGGVAARSGAPYRRGHVRFLGFTPHIRDVLAAGDLLVSPVRYEAYGLNVHEALCRGLAVMVTRDGGRRRAVRRRDVAGAAAARRHRRRASPIGCARGAATWRAGGRAPRRPAARLRARSWTAMAAELVAVAQRVADHGRRA